MDKKYDHKKYEEEISKMWQEGDYFKANAHSDKEPYCIILPPPNASGKMHTGNVLMIAIEDLLIRYKRMKGYEVLWVPGTDHAGFETQTTFERKLKKEGKSRFDFDRQTLYDMIMQFVLENKSAIEEQIKQMGASVDWSRYRFTLDKESIDTVTKTFEKLEKDGKIYRDNYLVNYSFKWGTTFSDAEIVYKESKTKLVYVRYKVVNPEENQPEYIVVATTRPETIPVDTHLAINPKDENKKWLLNKKVLNPITDKEMQFIEDPFVDMEFGTGVVKITPAHDKADFEVGQKHDLPVINLITLEGRLNENGGPLKGLKVLEAREKAIEILKEKGLVEKVDEEYENVVPVDYRSGDYVEQLVIPNWFVKVDEMKEMALKVFEEGKLKIYPKWRAVTYKRWVENMHDWAISRQVVWGIRIPAWYNVDENPDIKVNYLDDKGVLHKETIKEALDKFPLEIIEKGLQTLIAPPNATYKISQTKPGERYIQETDTFDTWFSSGQWPLITLGYPGSDDFKKFYPTSVLETGWEIITRWVSRMVMFGMYLTGEVPFYDVYLHGIVRAIDGKKMSKSLGNVINPEEYIEEFGVDALRMGLISGTANGKDFNFPRDKIIGYRKFTNKIWNMARFMLMMMEREGYDDANPLPFWTQEYKEEVKDLLVDQDQKVLEELSKTIKKVEEKIDQYRFADAGDLIYHFMWNEVADKYIEDVKNREGKTKEVGLVILRYVYLSSIKMLHPFMPFITEVIWAEIPKAEDNILAVSDWPNY